VTRAVKWDYRTKDVNHLPKRKRMVVLPAADRVASLADSWTGQLLVKDVDFYPQAAGHERTRERGADELLVMVCVGGRGAVVHDG
jgi:AraC family transcriptional regulator, arabinose operon regulatory protein